LLEGSVRKSGKALRIAAQLVRVSDSSPLWSYTYERNLTDIFAVQTDIATNVVQELREVLVAGRQDQVSEAGADA
jgi:TolB-like protein